MSTQQDARKLLDERRARDQRQSRAHRTLEFVLLLAASSIVGFGFWLVYHAKSANFDEAAQLVNLNALHDAAPLLPLLNEITDGAERRAPLPPAFWISRTTGTSPMWEPSPACANVAATVASPC